MQLLEGLDADTDALGVLSWYAVGPCLHKLALATSNATLEIRAVPQRRSTAGPVTSCRVAGGPLQRAIGHQKAVGDITRKKKCDNNNGTADRLCCYSWWLGHVWRPRAPDTRCAGPLALGNGSLRAAGLSRRVADYRDVHSMTWAPGRLR